MLIGAIVFVTLVIFIWAVYFRKRGRRHKHHHRSETQKAVTPAQRGATGGRCSCRDAASFSFHVYRRRCSSLGGVTAFCVSER